MEGGSGGFHTFLGVILLLHRPVPPSPHTPKKITLPTGSVAYPQRQHGIHLSHWDPEPNLGWPSTGTPSSPTAISVLYSTFLIHNSSGTQGLPALRALGLDPKDIGTSDIHWCDLQLKVDKLHIQAVESTGNTIQKGRMCRNWGKRIIYFALVLLLSHIDYSAPENRGTVQFICVSQPELRSQGCEKKMEAPYPGDWKEKIWRKWYSVSGTSLQVLHFSCYLFLLPSLFNWFIVIYF